MNFRSLPLSSLALCALLAAAGASAEGLRPAGIFATAGFAQHSAYSAHIGVVWPWDWHKRWGSTEFSGVTEASIGQWSGVDVGGRRSFTQVALVPMFRLRFSEGTSPFFLEGGIGLTYMDRKYTTINKQFATQFNFGDTLGMGVSFGEGRRQEVGLRVTHYSNGGYKKPNPGDNFLQLRYATAF